MRAVVPDPVQAVVEPEAVAAVVAPEAAVAEAPAVAAVLAAVVEVEAVPASEPRRLAGIAARARDMRCLAASEGTR